MSYFLKAILDVFLRMNASIEFAPVYTAWLFFLAMLYLVLNVTRKGYFFTKHGIPGQVGRAVYLAYRLLLVAVCPFAMVNYMWIPLNRTVLFVTTNVFSVNIALNGNFLSYASVALALLTWAVVLGICHVEKDLLSLSASVLTLTASKAKVLSRRGNRGFANRSTKARRTNQELRNLFTTTGPGSSGKNSMKTRSSHRLIRR